MANTDVYTILGERLREQRLCLSWTQEELAERAALHPSYIGQIERGTKKISLAVLKKLAEALGIAMGELLKEESLLYKKGAWDKRIAAVLRDKSAQQKQFAYRILKETIKFIPR